MKLLKNIIFIILNIFTFNISTAQTCLFDNLVDDLAQQNATFKAFVENENGFKAWQIVATEAPSLRTNMAELNAVLENLDFIEKIGTKNYTSWKLLKDANRKGLMNDANAVEALTRVRALPTKVKQQLGVTDEILASLNVSSKGEFAYSTLIDKITSIGKKLENSPNTKLEGFYDKVLYKLNKNSNATTNQKIGAEGVLKAVDDEFDNLLKGKTVRFENSVENIRGTTSYEDVNVEIVSFDGAKTAYRIEVKNCANCVTSKVIKEQFIERDLFNATDISQIKWKIYRQNFTKADFEKFLKENRNAIENLGEEKVKKFFGVDLSQGEIITNNVISNFVNNSYSKIFH